MHGLDLDCVRARGLRTGHWRKIVRDLRRRRSADAADDRRRPCRGRTAFAGLRLPRRRPAQPASVLEHAGIATAADVAIDDMAERLLKKAVAQNACIMLPPLVGTWVELPA
jgi:hypothetical protein